MDSRRPGGRPSRPNTLGEAWRRASQPRPRKADHLPPLPDWPPMRGERLEDRAGAEWPSLGPSPSIGDAARDDRSSGDYRDYRDYRDERADRDDRDDRVERDDPRNAASAQRKPDRQRPALDLWRRWRGATRKVQVLVVAAILLPLLLIGGCSTLALQALNGANLGASSALLGTQATQQTSAVNSTPLANATATSASSAATSAPTHAPTTAPSVALTLAITCASGAIRGTGKICVKTQPSAALNISVIYCDGASAKGLRGAATADASGAYTWTWPVRTSCAGTATATVTAQWQGQKITQTQKFTITS